MSNINPQSLLAELADAVSLREGANGISNALWCLHSGKAYSTHEWSRSVRLPVPVLAALRRELEKREILASEKRIVISEHGKKILEEIFHTKSIPTSTCPACHGLGLVTPPAIYSLIEEMDKIGANRPPVDVTLDQSHATPQTAIRKALLLLEHGLLQQSILFMGDDDLISLACFLVRKHFINNPENVGGIHVLDIDPRYLDYIKSISGDTIATAEYDVRQDLPRQYHQQFKTVLTDPAYTLNGITTFAFRCMQAVHDEGFLYLSMPQVDPAVSGQVQSKLLDMGWTLRDQYKNFNQYIGASIHAHVSSLYIWQKWKLCRENLSAFLSGNPEFYTADRKKNRVK